MKKEKIFILKELAGMKTTARRLIGYKEALILGSWNCRNMITSIDHPSVSLLSIV
jgi:hypothetical protein